MVNNQTVENNPTLIHTNARVEATANNLQTNSDFAILQSARIDINANIPVITQALRIAIYDEMKAYETYMQIIEKFGAVEPFVNIVEAEKRHYVMLLQLLEKYAVEIPNDDFSATIVLPQTLLEACELGVVAELENIKMYDNLIENTKEYPDVQEVFFQLQAASYNNHLVAFRRAVQSVYTQAFSGENQNNPNQDMQNLAGFEQTISKLDDFSKTISDFSNGKMDQNAIVNMLNNKNVSLLGGAVLGALGAVLLSQNLNNKEDNKEEGEAR